MELIVLQLAKHNGVTEQLKAEKQMEWVRQMNAWEHQKILRTVPQNNSGLITHHHRNEKVSFQVLSHFSLLLLLS